MSEDENLLVALFRQRNETNRWQSEFWGKWTLGAIGAYRYNRDPQLLQKIGNGVSGLLSTQSEDGYIGNYAPEAQLTNWDVWGQKYTLLGLLAYYDPDRRQKAIRRSLQAGRPPDDRDSGEKRDRDGRHLRDCRPARSSNRSSIYITVRGTASTSTSAKYIVGRWETDKVAVDRQSAGQGSGGGALPVQKRLGNLVFVGQRAKSL